MNVTDAGIVIVYKDKAGRKAYPSIVVNELFDSKITELKLEQFVKA